MADSPLTLTTPEIQLKRESCWPEILKRLPAKQLGICLCVSQKWNNLINSSVFITSHLNFISNTHVSKSNLFIIRSFFQKYPQRNPKEFYFICSETLETLKTLETLETLKTLKTLETLKTLAKSSFVCPFRSRNGLQFRMVGSVNGVIFLSDDYFKSNYTFILWNPIVKCFIHLPKPKACVELIGPYISVSGFGYDGVGNDFKVVRMVYPQRKDGLDETPPRAEVYSVNEGKWRWICADKVEYCTVDKEWSQCFLKGNVHWVAYDRWGEEKRGSHKSNVLLLFNVEKETFFMMKLPLELREVCPLGLMVSECQGMLCVKHYVITDVLVGELVECNVWVKKEYNKGASWMKVASVDVRAGVVQQIIYRRKNGELLGSSKFKELVSYDPVTKKVVALAPGIPGLYEACSFVESLAFLNQDCKNRRSFLEEDGNGSSDDEDLRPEDMEHAKMEKFISFVNQVEKFRREF